MGQVIIQPAASDDAREHYRNTILSPVELRKHRSLLGADLSPLRGLFSSGRAPLWGVTPGKSGANTAKYAQAEVGALVLFTGQKRAYSSGVLVHKFDNRVPEYQGEPMPIPLGELTGREIPSPEGVTVQFTGAELYRSPDVAPLLTFAIAVAAGVSSDLIARWIIDRFRGKVDGITINRRHIDLNDEGQIVRVITEEITRERGV